MLDTSNLRKEPFDVATIEEEVSSLIGAGSPNAFAPAIRRPLDRILRAGAESGVQDVTEMAEPAGPEDASQDRTVEEILAERSKTHGDFTDNARVMQSLKRIVHDEVGWNRLTDVQREALHMILHKVGRIISGNPNVKDHWDDIAGYAKLTSERIIES